MTLTAAAKPVGDGKAANLAIGLGCGIPILIVIVVAIVLWMRFFGPLPVVDDLKYGSSAPQCFRVSSELFVVQVPISPVSDSAYVDDVDLSGPSALELVAAHLAEPGVPWYDTDTPPSIDVVNQWIDPEGYFGLGESIGQEQRLLLLVVSADSTAAESTATGLDFTYQGGPENAFRENMAVPLEISDSGCEVSFIEGKTDAQVRGSR